MRKFDIMSLYICLPYLYTVAILSWEIHKSFFQQYYSYILQITYIISEDGNRPFCVSEPPPSEP